MAPKPTPSWRQNYTPRPMPSTPLSTSFSVSSSSCSKLISLTDWWLIKSQTDVNGNRLAVGGYHYSCEEKTMHIFTSAPVVKTFDPYTLETADGSILRLQGGINRSRMQQNGFPPEVSSCFFIGFPYNWECYAKKDYGPIIPNSTTFPTSSVISNDEIFPVPVAFEFSLVKLFNDCASNPDSSVDDLLIKKLTSNPVNTELHSTSSISSGSVQSETISTSEKDNDDVERCVQHERHELHNGVSCEHLISSSLNANFDSQNGSIQMLQIEHLSNEESEINNENLCFENTFDSVKSTDDFSTALLPEDLKSLHTQQKDNSNKGSEFITRKMSLMLEASFESPQACAQRNTNTESNSHSGDKVSSTILSPVASSMLKQMMRRKRYGSKLNLRAERIRVNTPNDGSDDFGSTFIENTDILHPAGKKSTENDVKTLSANASPVGKDNSACDVGKAQCYMLRSHDAKMEINSPNFEKNLKSKPLNLSKLDSTESQNATCVDNSNQNSGGNSSHDTGGRATSTNLKDKCEGGQILESALEVECEGTYNANDINKHANDIGNIEQCINKMSAINEDVLITQTKDFPKCRSDYSEMPSGTWIENRDDTNGTVESEKDAGITNNQDENQDEVIQESKASKLKKARNQEMKSPLTCGKIEKQEANLSTSPELQNPRRSRSGRLLLRPINHWKRKIVYDMNGTITNIGDVDNLTAVTEGTSSKRSRRRK